MVKDFQERFERDEETGLNPDEPAFYDAVANYKKAVRELGNEALKKITAEVTEKLRATPLLIGNCEIVYAQNSKFLSDDCCANSKYSLCQAR